MVDPREGSAADRVFVMSSFGEPSSSHPPPGRSKSRHLRHQRLVVAVHGEAAITRWVIRCVGASSTYLAVRTPIHLHGFYFTVEATGDIGIERRLAPGQQRRAVTEYLGAGRTFLMSWTPERPGNWLFHCHMTIAHEVRPPTAPTPATGPTIAQTGMAGLVLGIQVTGERARSRHRMAAHHGVSLLVMREEPNRYGNQSGYRIDLEGQEH